MLRAGLLVLVGLGACAAVRPSLPRPEAPFDDVPDPTEVARVLGMPAAPDRASFVLRASLQSDTAIATLQAEQSDVQDDLNAVQAQQNGQVTLLNLAAAVFSIGDAAGTGMTLSSNNSVVTAGNALATVTGVVGGALSLAALLLPTRGRAPQRIRRASLAPLLGRAQPEGMYPPLVWRWLESGPLTRLVARWKREGILDDARRVEWLVSPLPGNRTAGVDELQDRNQMLSDARAQVALLKQGLSALLDAQ